MEKYLINPNQKISKISKDIYGHFSEHLGRCIYDGMYVGGQFENLQNAIRTLLVVIPIALLLILLLLFFAFRSVTWS